MQNLAPSKENRKKFDIDLEYGKVREQLVADMLQDKKIEVKSERGMWQESLRKIIKNLDYKKSVSGGDNMASRMYLLNLQKLFSSDVIKAFKQNKGE